MVTALSAQTVYLDHEAAATTTVFQYFGSTLDGTVSEVIANPDKSGINESDSVGIHIKPANSTVFAGAFSNPDFDPAIDLSSESDICMKVWMPEPGTVRLKLENGTLANWETEQTVSTGMEWVEVCWDSREPSIAGPFETAAGGSYARAVLFFNFDIVYDEDQTYYFDDLVTKEAAATANDVTFSVDMNDYDGTFTTVFLSGTFNDFSDNGNPMDDTDGDGVWETTVTGIASGTIEYLFQLDEFAQQEVFTGFETCVVTDPTGMFTNRRLAVTENTTVPTVCYNSCYACGDAVNITINLGDAGVDVDPAGFFIAGGGNFGNPGDFPLTDNGDGTHSITVEREKGFTSFYTFTNGACPDYSCKEDIAGQDCANPDNFNDRDMGPINSDTTIATCFGQCSETTDCAVVEPVSVTFEVDMEPYDMAFTTVFLSGTFNSFSPDANPMEDADGDGVWTTTIDLNPGSYEYKFQLDMWNDQEIFTDGDPCTITSPNGNYVNRFLEVDETTDSLCFQFALCVECGSVGTRDLDQVDDLFTMIPTIATDQVNLFLNAPSADDVQITVFNQLGESVILQETTGGQSTLTLETNQLAAGLHIVHVQSGSTYQLQKLIIVR